MKKRLGYLFILACLTFTLGCVMLAGCNKGPKITETFTDWEVTVEDETKLGNEYALDKSATSDSGKTYDLTYDVTRNSDNGKVDVVFNTFLVDSVSGYKIVYTAKVSDTEEHTRTVNLKVVDDGAPNVVIKDFDVFVGVKSTLPEIIITDAGDSNPQKEVSIYNKDTKEAVKITNNEFTINEIGEYEIKVVAKDSAGNEEVITKSFYVRNAIKDNEVLLPDSAGVLNNVDCTKFSAGVKATGFEYVAGDETADYKKPYVRFYDKRTEEQLNDEKTLNDGGFGGDLWVTMGLRPRNSKENLSNYKYIRAWIYYEFQNFEGEKEVNYFGYVGDGLQKRKITANKWQLVELEMNSLLALYNEDGYVEDFINCNKMINTDGCLRGIRVGEVYGYNYADLSFNDESQQHIKGDTVNLTLVNPHDVEVEITVTAEDGTVTAFTFENGVISFLADKTGRYTVTASSKDAEITDKDGVKYSCEVGVDGVYTITPDEFVNTAVAGEEITLPTAKVKNTVTGELVENPVTVTAKYVYNAGGEEVVNGATYTPSASGKLVVEFSYTDALANVVEINVDPMVYAENVLLDASSKDVLLRNWFMGNGGTLVPEFIEATASEESYVKLTFDDAAADWHQFYFKPYKDREFYQTYKYIKMETMIETNFGNGSGLACPAQFGYGTKTDGNTWQTLYIPIENYIAKCKGQKGTVELDTLKIKTEYFGNITAICLRNIEAVNEAPVVPDSYSLIDNGNASGNLVIWEGSSENTARKVTFTDVVTDGVNPAYLKIDFADILNEGEMAYWTKIYLDLKDKQIHNDYNYFTVTFRYTSDNTVKQGEDGFGGVNAMRVDHKKTSTNQWYTMVVDKNHVRDNGRWGCIDLFYVKAMGVAGTYGHGHITSVDVAEVTAHKELPAELGIHEVYSLNIGDYKSSAVVGEEIAIPAATFKKSVTDTSVTNLDKSAKFVFATGGEEVVEGATYTPALSGELVIDYSLNGIALKSISIKVAQKVHANSVLFEADSKDAVLQNWKMGGTTGSVIPEFIEATGDEAAYLKLNFSEDTTADWHQIYFTPYKDRASYQSYKYIKMEVKSFTETSVLFDQLSLGYGAIGETNMWHTIYVPMEKYVAKCKGPDKNSVELDTLKLKLSYNGTIVGFGIRNIEAVNEIPDTSKILDVTKDTDKVIAREGNGPTSKPVKYVAVAGDGVNPAYLKVDFSEMTADWWAPICLKLNENVINPEYQYFTITIRYTAKRTVNKGDESFGGITVFTKELANPSTNDWYTVVLTRDQLLKTSKKTGTYIEICCPKIVPNNNQWAHGSITSVDIAELTGCETMPNNSVSLLDINNAKDSIVIRENNSPDITKRDVKLVPVAKTEADPAYLRIDFTNVLQEKEAAWWTNGFLKLSPDVKSGEYQFITITIRYTATNTISKGTDGFGGVEVFRKAQPESTTNAWVTVTVTRQDAINAIRHGDIHLFTAKTMGTINNSGHGHITSVDIAEITAYRTNPNA